jgi:CBS domain-containing protein
VKVKDIMTTDLYLTGPDAPVTEAARLMKDFDIGLVPVCRKQEVVGVVTDRDICIEVVAKGRVADRSRVEEIMSSPVVWCYDDTPVEEAARMMETRQVRRLIVIDRNKKLAGIVALGDVATRANERLAGEALEKISEPTHPIH